MSARGDGDRERDLAALERGRAEEYQDIASQSVSDESQRTATGLAELHLYAAGLLDELARIFDEIETAQEAARWRHS